MDEILTLEDEQNTGMPEGLRQMRDDLIEAGDAAGTGGYRDRSESLTAIPIPTQHALRATRRQRRCCSSMASARVWSVAGVDC